MKRLAACVAAILLACMLHASSWHAFACALDGKPSLIVDGRRVLLNETVPGPRDLPLYAPFILAHPVRVGAQVTLREDRNQVTLPAEGFRRPWRWRFGDHSSVAFGASTTHRFARPGRYKVEVDAYVPSLHRWLTFDALDLNAR